MNEKIDKDLSALSEALLESYAQAPHTQRVGHSFLPSREKIVAVLDDLRALLFPGFFGENELTPQTVSFHVGRQLASLGRKLTEQIHYCMCYAGDGEASCTAKAKAAAHEMLRRLPDIRAKLALDAQAAFDGDPAAKSIDEVIYCYPGFYAVTVYRIAHELLTLGVPLMPRIMTEHAHSVTGCDIHPGSQIGKSFFIDHATGVVIGETSRIGDNVKIYQGVTLGALSFPKDERGRAIKGLQRHPTLMDNVTVYANATILGGQTVIGKGVTVGGNTFIIESITEQSTVTARGPELQVRSKKRPG